MLDMQSLRSVRNTAELGPNTANTGPSFDKMWPGLGQLWASSTGPVSTWARDGPTSEKVHDHGSGTTIYQCSESRGTGAAEWLALPIQSRAHDRKRIAGRHLPRLADDSVRPSAPKACPHVFYLSCCAPQCSNNNAPRMGSRCQNQRPHRIGSPLCTSPSNGRARNSTESSTCTSSKKRPLPPSDTSQPPGAICRRRPPAGPRRRRPGG